ncbi:hypothetical protein GS399_07065 [Pedobacter sp. HMF7647]|uniref:Uncharacterized protein n=1 Tax=Hufsiella arboris TaxID=2695275 RepID=A0A7K1Y8I3_9SPHI|nr:hypothetical protein [Hufsiella arboris]MXV50730.1 hypothetical protein [Hufsiella arboris]
MKKLLLFLFCGIMTGQAQTLQEKVQGDWVCTGITDTLGKAASGRFGESIDFLQLSFVQDTVFISQAPFDEGFEFMTLFDLYSVDVIDPYVYGSQRYLVKSASKDSLILSTLNMKNELVNFHFVNQAQFLKFSTDDVIDNGTIILKYGKINEKADYPTSFAMYRVNNTQPFLIPRPLFADNESLAFGNFIASAFHGYRFLQPGVVSDEMIIEFDVSKDGVSNVAVLQGFNAKINEMITKIVQRSSKFWKPLKIGQQPVKTAMRFHFVLYKEK